MQKKILTLFATACFSIATLAQETIFNKNEIESPVINKDGTVTFNLYAPKAVIVNVTGDFLYNTNADYRKFLDSKGYKYEYFESEGGHIWRNWRLYLTMFSQRLFK